MPVIAGIGLNLTSVAPGDLDGADRLMARWAELGCSHVEVSARRLDIILGGRLNMPAVKRVAGMIERHGMVPVLHAPHAINLMDRPRREMHIAVSEASIEFCRITGCRSMVLHSGRVDLQEWVLRSGRAPVRGVRPPAAPWGSGRQGGCQPRRREPHREPIQCGHGDLWLRP